MMLDATRHYDQPLTDGRLFGAACLPVSGRAQRDDEDQGGLPFFLLLGMVMAGVGTGARNAPPHPLRNALPFFLVLAIWAVAFLLMRKKLGRENLEQEIEELRAFERENR